MRLTLPATQARQIREQLAAVLPADSRPDRERPTADVLTEFRLLRQEIGRALRERIDGAGISSPLSSWCTMRSTAR